MAFLPNIPQSTDQLSISQGNILNNFTILGDIAGNSSTSSNSINTTAGFNWLYLPPQGATPPAGGAFTAGNIALYSAFNTVTSQNELYINKQDQATTVQIAATASTLSITAAPGSGTGGWTYLPSGILLMFGNVTGLTGTATVTILTGPTIPVFTQMLSVLVSPFNSTAGDQNFAVRLISILSNTQFSVYVSSRTATGSATGGIQYLAIGY